MSADFITYDNLSEEQQSLVDSKDVVDRREAASYGWGLDKLYTDEHPSVRREVARQKYRLNDLMNDFDEDVANVVMMVIVDDPSCMSQIMNPKWADWIHVNATEYVDEVFPFLSNDERNAILDPINARWLELGGHRIVSIEQELLEDDDLDYDNFDDSEFYSDSLAPFDVFEDALLYEEDIEINGEIFRMSSLRDDFDIEDLEQDYFYI